MDGAAKLWDALSGRLLASFEAHVGPVPAVAFSPDGTRLVTGGSDGLAMVWDLGAEERSPPQIAELARKYAPYRMKEGHLVPTENEKGR